MKCVAVTVRVVTVARKEEQYAVAEAYSSRSVPNTLGIKVGAHLKTALDQSVARMRESTRDGTLVCLSLTAE